MTLHVGLGTFRPVKVEDVTQHHMHSEFYVVEEDQAALINETKKKGGKIISVGTTSLRTLESASSEDGTLKGVDCDLLLDAGAYLGNSLNYARTVAHKLFRGYKSVSYTHLVSAFIRETTTSC